MPYKDKNQKQKSDHDRRQRLKALGYCTSCYGRIPEDGLKTCSVCRSKYTPERMKEIRQDRRKLDLCANCGRQLDMDDKKTCKHCKEKTKEFKRVLKMFKDGL